MKLTSKPLRVLSYVEAATYDPTRPELANNGGNYPQPTIVVGNGNVTVTIDDCSLVTSAAAFMWRSKPSASSTTRHTAVCSTRMRGIPTSRSLCGRLSAKLGSSPGTVESPCVTGCSHNSRNGLRAVCRGMAARY